MRRTVVVGATVLASVAAAPAAHGAGLIFYEMATPDMGTASAGRAALAQDAATAFGNPAGMTRLDGSQVLVGVQPAYGISKFDADPATTTGGGNGGNALGPIPSLGLYGVHGITQDLKVGLSISSYFGLAAQYEDDWVGRYYGVKSELVTFGAFPVAAYRVNPWLSVGGGAQILYGTQESESAVNNIVGPDARLRVKGDDVGYGWMAGVLLEPLPGTRFGLGYLSKVDLDFEDEARIKGAGPLLELLLDRTGLAGSEVDLGFNVPQQVTASGYHELTDRLAVVGNVVWQDWSEFGRVGLGLTATDGSGLTYDLDYDDTWGVSLGVRYRVADRWLWSVGAAYDTSPASQSNRSVNLPLDRQIRLATGIQYHLSERVTVGAAYTYLDLGSADLDLDRGPLAGRVEGDYSPNAVHFLNVNCAFRL